MVLTSPAEVAARANDLPDRGGNAGPGAVAGVVEGIDNQWRPVPRRGEEGGEAGPVLPGGVLAAALVCGRLSVDDGVLGERMPDEPGRVLGLPAEP